MNLNYTMIMTLLVLLLLVPTKSFAGPGHDHAHTHHAAENHSHAAVSIDTIWENLEQTVQQLKVALEEESYKRIDDLNHALEDIVKDLLHANPHSEEIRKRRFDGAVTQLKKASDELHEQGHHPTRDGISKALSKLEGAMRMLEVQIESEDR